MPTAAFPTPTPDQIHFALAILIPILDQYVATKAPAWVKFGWSIVRPFLVAADPQALAAAHAAMPETSKVA